MLCINIIIPCSNVCVCVGGWGVGGGGREGEEQDLP